MEQTHLEFTAVTRDLYHIRASEGLLGLEAQLHPWGGGQANTRPVARPAGPPWACAPRSPLCGSRLGGPPHAGATAALVSASVLLTAVCEPWFSYFVALRRDRHTVLLY